MEVQMHLASAAGSPGAGRCGATHRTGRALFPGVHERHPGVRLTWVWLASLCPVFVVRRAEAGWPPTSPHGMDAADVATIIAQQRGA